LAKKPSKYDRVAGVITYVRRNKHTGKPEVIDRHKRHTSYDVPMTEIRRMHLARPELNRTVDNVIRANLISPWQWIHMPGSGDIDGVDRAPAFELRNIETSTYCKHLLDKIWKFYYRTPKRIRVNVFKGSKKMAEMTKGEFSTYFNKKLNTGWNRNERQLIAGMNQFLNNFAKLSRSELNKERSKKGKK
jgi:hypothetical protein